MLGQIIIEIKVGAYRYSVLILGCALAGAVWLGVLLQIRSEYDKQVAAIETEMNGQTLVLGSHVVRTLKELDRALLIIRDYVNIERQRNGGTIPWEALRLPSHDVVSSVAMQIGLIDEHGRFRVSNVRIDPSKPMDHSDRDHFRMHRASRADQLFINAPALGRLTGVWYLQLSRPLVAGPKTFSGIITGSLNPAQFFAIYPPLDIGSDGSMSIVGLDGIVRGSFGPRALELGANRSDLGVTEAIYGHMFRTRLQHSGNGRYHFVAYRKVEGYPLVLRIEKSRHEALAGYYLRRMYYSLFGASLTLIIALGLFGGAQYQQKLRQAAEAAKSSEELASRKSRELALTLDHIGQGILMVDEGRQIVFMNELAMKLVDLPADFDTAKVTFDELVELLRARGEFTNRQGEEDSALIGHILQPDRSNVVDVHQRTRPDGRVLEIRTAVLPEGGFVRTLTDITQRRRSELALERQHALLQQREEELGAQNVRFDMALRNMSQGLSMFDAEQRLVVCNERYAQMYGLPPELVRPGTTLRRILEHRGASGLVRTSIEAYHQELSTVVADSRPWTKVRELGDGRAVSVVTQPMPGGGWVATHDDVTEHRRLERQLGEQNERLRQQEEELRTQNVWFKAALENLGAGLCLFDGQKRLVVCNDRYAELYGLPPELLKVGTPHRAIIAHRVLSGVLKGEQSDGAVDKRLSALGALPAAAASSRIDELADGRLICVKRQPLEGGGWVATHEDVTEQRRSEAKILHMAEHDALTDLPNRVLLRAQLNKALGNVHRDDRRLAVLMLDLDRFKEVNDTLGHPVGDALLMAVAERLRGCVRETDVVARLGGDEFAILETEVETSADAAALATRIQAAMSEPFELDGQHFIIATSIGISVAPEDGADPDQLLKNADLALYRAKREGHGVYRFFEPEMNLRMQARRDLEYGLRNALANGEFELWYQPFVNLESDEVCGFEALLRWNHPERRAASPADFIPLAEETGLIVPIGEWVLRQACAEAATWPDRLRISVNLSAAQFKGRSLVQAVIGALAASGLAPDRLELEITESVMLQDSEVAFTTLTQLRDLGVRIALDDFGTGYSSLSYLRKFPFGRIKIDRGFVSELSEAKEDSLAIVRSVIRLGNSLGMATTAEGVETKQQLDRVRAEGCTEMQGFYFSPPRPAAEIRRLFLKSAPDSADAA
jgi:diguanylate cyclase (GGDEF)-like protein